MSASFIVAAAREIDGALDVSEAPVNKSAPSTTDAPAASSGNLASLRAQWRELQQQGARLAELVIDPLAAGWDTPVALNHFRSGCAPLEALARADQLVRGGDAYAVLIRGEDNLCTGYERAERARLMGIYREYSIPQAYTLLAREFMQLHDLTDADFRDLADALFENYLLTARQKSNFQPPKASAEKMATGLFRLRDCANPNIDFVGAVIVAPSPEIARANFSVIEIRAVALAQSSGDGPQHIAELARYDHLRAACEAVSQNAQLDFARAFRDGDALLEAYTCFPVAPLGFLLGSGIVNDLAQVPAMLQKQEITVTGGMNLARAPWNNPALNALIAMCYQLSHGTQKLGVLHGNGGLGYRQGVAILQR